MLKRLSIKKITLTSTALFATFLIYLIPANQPKLDVSESLEYVSNNQNTNPIFLMDKNSYVSLTKVVLTSSQIEDKAKELLNILIEGESSSKIPNGFKAIIPPNTQILSLNYEKGLIKVDFSSDLLDINEELEEKMIEAIVYTLTSIDDVNKVIIYVEGEILTKLPKSKLNLPSTLDRSYGINKEYDFTTTSKINEVTIYYVNKMNKDYYYVPVTKYLNDNRDKITIIVDELTNSLNYNKNLMSFLNSETKLTSQSIENDTLSLNFNTYLFDDVTTKEVLEEVIYTICLSAYDNYNVKNVVLAVENEQIYKTSSKNLETEKKI